MPISNYIQTSETKHPEQLSSLRLSRAKQLLRAVLEKSGSGSQVFTRLQKYFLFHKKPEGILIRTGSEPRVFSSSTGKQNLFINLSLLNNVSALHKSLNSFNQLLNLNGVFIGVAETYDERYQKMAQKYGKVLALGLKCLDFFIHRLWPRVRGFNKLYFLLTGGRLKAFSKAELIGRLYCNGFQIEEVFTDNNRFYFAARKCKEQVFSIERNYKLIYKLKKIGLNGKSFSLYKLRTTHPYAEYVPDIAVLMFNGKKSFKCSALGRFLEKSGLDKVPQIINLLNGSIGFKGHKAVSNYTYLQMQESNRRNYILRKPGLFFLAEQNN